ncbi:LacI family transcriptional regulator [Streptomyces sp. RB6PN25]|uniref:LacI family transcriptional regulator n=1 Tax=Streptomyces humicola TaxID=2953240 RepID=A0ABT1PQA9_9ACTN|nr:LacI family DNA-binding transcriptional regulator [Streptomyces humicola]MCQ4079851.1 LacI family transcriptional regulator [Streptomyces humicola]
MTSHPQQPAEEPSSAPARPARRTPARRPTMKDIARRAGVSESAVSFALNDRPGVSEVTRDRVRRVAEQLGWRPSSAARALSGEGAGTVGLVLARPARTLGVESFFLQLISGIQQVLAQRQLGLLFQVVEDIDAECATYRRWWAERRVDGVLVVDPRSFDPRPGLLDSLGLPTVVIGGMGSGEHGGPSGEQYASLSTLWADDAGAMALIADHLHSLGHRRIVHIAGLPGLAHTERRIRSLRDEAGRLGLTGVRSVTTDYSDTEGAAATRRVLDDETPPTAIIYDNDVMAAAGASVAAARGLSIPRDLSVVAWEDSVLCRMTHPWLTALARDTIAFGQAAAQQLTDLLDGVPARTVQVPLPELVVRESTGAPRGRSPRST